ncbi:hypothetical protein BGZ94_005747, partial [Podila epigama]
TIMERNMEVSIDFGNTIESLPLYERAHQNLQNTPRTAGIKLASHIKPYQDPFLWRRT